MSLPKFNLNKLRKSVSRQQKDMKKSIADLLLLDRLQSQLKKENKESNMSGKYIKGLFKLKIELLPDQDAEIEGKPDYFYIIPKDFVDKGKETFFKEHIVNSFADYEKHLFSDELLWYWYRSIEDNITFDSNGWSGEGGITLTVKESELIKLSKKSEGTLEENKDGIITSFSYTVSNSDYDTDIGIEAYFFLNFELKEIIEVIEVE